MNSINITGKLGQKPVLKYTSTGKPYVKFSLAVHRYSYSFNTNYCWINCECYDNAALYLVRSADKGMDIAISGELQTYSINKNGHLQECYSVVCKAVEVYRTDRRKYVSDDGISTDLTNIPEEKDIKTNEDLEK